MDQNPNPNLDRRIELQGILTTLLGSSHVYFQPPESVKLVYPCIIYRLSNIDVTRADNTMYLGKKRYMITIVSRDPDYLLYEEILKLPYSYFDRFYTADNLNHWVLELYY